MTQTITLTDLLARHKPAYGDSWVDAIQNMVDDPVELETIVVLVDAIQAGRLREPVFLFPGDDEDPPGVNNGMHRIAAAVLAGGLDVPVRYESRPDDFEYYLRTVVVHQGPFPNDEEHWHVMDVLRSFPINDDVWIEADSIGGTMNAEGCTTEFLYYARGGVTQELLAPALDERIKKWNLPITVKSITPLTDAELEAEYA